MPHKGDISEIDWSKLCPEGFQKMVKEVLDNPPSLPDSSSISSDSPQEKKGKGSEHKRYAEALGKYAEAKTIEYLVLQGLPIRAWNWQPKSGRGEIDIISQRGERLLFIEVKARADKSNDPWEAIDEKKIRELCRGADIYIKSNNLDLEYQFDIALFSGTPDDQTFEYIEDAFLCPLSVRR